MFRMGQFIHHLLIVVPARSRALAMPSAAEVSLSRTASAIVRSDSLSATGRSPGPLPTFLVKAQRDAQARRQLASLGYRSVLAAYGRQLPTSRPSDEFHGLAGLGLWPTMAFVGDWLGTEKRRYRARFRVTFFRAMLVTVLVGLALNLVYAPFSP